MTNCYLCIHAELVSNGEYHNALYCNKWYLMLPSKPDDCTNFEPIFKPNEP